MYGARRGRDGDPSNVPRAPEAGPDQSTLIRKLHINFDEVFVAAVENRIIVYEGQKLSPIDVLADHEHTVRGLDVSKLLRNIVSFSRSATSDDTTFMVHCLMEAQHVRNQEEPHERVLRPASIEDQSVYTGGHLRWTLTYKVSLSTYRLPKCIGISAIGDFCVMGGNKYVALWTIDSLMDSYSQWALYSEQATEDKAECVEEVEDFAGDVVQAEVCGSGRLFATLEKDDHTVKIWHNDDTTLEVPAAGSSDVEFRRLMCQPGLIEFSTLPRHRNKIENFSFYSGVAPNQREIQPSILVTVTRRKAFVWVESLEVPGMAFTNAYAFDIFYDARFIDMQRLAPRSDLKPLDLRYDCSKIFHSFKDEEKRCKKQMQQENPFGLVPSVLGGNQRRPTSIDWLLSLMENSLVLFQCKGLRCAPAEQIECTPKHKILFDDQLGQSLSLTRLLSATSARAGTFDDFFNFVAIDDSHINVLKHTVKLRKNVAPGGSQVADLNTAIRVNAPDHFKADQMLTHNSLPLVALIYKDMGLVQVYKLEDEVHPAVHEGYFKLHGTYKTRGSAILDCQWVTDLDQLLILTQSADEQSRIELVSADSTMKMLSLFGNRAGLQAEVNKSLGASPSSFNLTTYNKVATFKAGDLTEKVKNIVMVKCEVKAQDQPHTYPSETIIFAAIDSLGKSVLVQLRFQVNMDKEVCELTQRTLHKKAPFAGAFTLTKQLACHHSSIDDKTYVLLLAQKEPEIAKTQANVRGPAIKPKAQLELLSVCPKTGFKTKFAAPGTAEDLLEHPIVAKFGTSMLAIQVFQGPYQKEEQLIYLYNLESEAYAGYLNVTKMLGLESGRQPADLLFLEEKIKGAIALTVADRFYVIYQSQQCWDFLLKSDPLTSCGQLNQAVRLAAVALPNQDRQIIISLHNERTLVAHKETKLLGKSYKDGDMAAKRLAIPASCELHRLIIQKQRSQGLFHPNLLAELYYKGYGAFVVKILLKLKELLEVAAEQQRVDKLSDYLDMDLETLLIELKTQAEQLIANSQQSNVPAQEPAKPKKQAAFSVFDDLDESDSEDEKPEEVKEEEVKDENEPGKLFKDGADGLVSLLTQKQAFQSLGMDASQTKLLVVFILKFKNIFELDFYVDTLASMLLRKVFFETEKFDEAIFEQAKAELDKNEAAAAAAAANQEVDEEAAFMNYKVEEVKPFSDEEYMAVHFQESKAKSIGDLGLISDWTSAMVCQALHSENQEVIMNFLAERFNFEKNLTWETMRKLCIPVWLKDVSQLKKYIDYIAKTEYRINEGRPAMCKADYAAIWYTLLGRKSVLSSLYQREVGQEKFAQFFQKDFSVEKTRVIAQKNGLALVSKQKYHLACSFLILGEKIDTAVKVALDYLKDPVLALLMCRVMDPEDKSGCLGTLLQEWYIKRGEKFNDPFLINMGYWLKKDFVKSVNELAPDHEESGLDYFYKHNVIEFDLQDKKVEDKSEDQGPSNLKGKKVYPVVSKRNYVLLDLLKRLRVAPDVKRALNKAWATSKAPGKSGGAGSIFDDFLGGGSDSSSEEVEEKKEEIQVDDSLMLSQAIKQTLIQRQTVLGLLLIEENHESVKQVTRSQVDRLTQTVLLDLLVNVVESEGSDQGVKLIKKGMTLLSKFQADQEATKTTAAIQDANSNDKFLLKQLQLFGLLKFQVDYLAEQGYSREKLIRIGAKIIEEHTSRLLCVVKQLSVCGGVLLQANDYNYDSCGAILAFVEHIELVLNCMMILDFPNPAEAPGSASRSLLNKPKGIPSPVKQPSQAYASPDRKFNGLGLVHSKMGGDEGIAAEEDSDEEIAQQEVKQIMTSSPMMSEPASPHPQFMNRGSEDLDLAEQDKFELANTVASKLRADLVLLLALQTLAFQLKKLNLAKNLGEELKMLLGISFFADNLENMTITEEQLESIKTTAQLNIVKEYLIKIKGTLKQHIEFSKTKDLDGHGQIRRKASKNVHKEWQSIYDFLEIWLANFVVEKTASLLTLKRLDQVSLLKTNLLQDRQCLDVKHLQTLITDHSRCSVAEVVNDAFTRLDKQQKDMATHIFTQVLKPVNQRLVICELNQIIENRYQTLESKNLNMSYFFSSVEKLKYFAATYELHEKHSLLEDLQLGLIGQRTALRPNMPEEPDSAIQTNYFCTGVELYKQRDAVSDFCFDHSDEGDMMAIAVQAKGMREISVIDTLVYRQWREGGLEMIDEDQMSWSDCLHRYAPIKQVHSDIKPNTDTVRAALYGMYTHTTATETKRAYRPASALMLDLEARPPKYWGQELSSNYQKTWSTLPITHDDYSNAMDSHPYLPLYLTGNAKGLICLWNFGQMADKSLSQWMIDKDTPPNTANPKKTTVKRIEFNSYGDKFGALNMGGNLVMMNFDLETSSKVDPLFSTLHSSRLSDIRLSDFSFLDRDSILAGVSLKDKVLNVYDSLLPPRQALVQSHSAGAGGNLMQVCSDSQRVLCFNAKPGYVSEYDLRKEGDCISTKMLCKEEVTAVAITPDQKHLVLGQNDGIVKIFEISTKNLTEKGAVNAFVNVNGRKGGVSRLRFHPHSGALFASSNVGCVKLLRLAI